MSNSAKKRALASAVSEPVFKKRKVSNKKEKDLDEMNAFLDDDSDEEQDESNNVVITKNEKTISKKSIKKNDKSSKKRKSESKSKTKKHSKKSELVIDPLPIASDDWDSLDLTEDTRIGIESMGFTQMMKIQKLSIPLLLNGHNLVGSARTGSGKTLAFLVPIIEKVVTLDWDYMQDGVAALIISPTRELSMQIRKVAIQLCQYHTALTIGLLIGGNPRHSDIVYIIKGMTIAICTPGRLLDHLIRTKEFNVKNLKMLCLDEADRILDEGYKEEMTQILKFLPTKNRQNMLFSATQTRNTKDLIRLSFNSKPKFVSDGSCIDYSSIFLSSKQKSVPTPSCLVQGYILVPSQNKFLLLFSFLKKHGRNKKIMVFFSTVAVTKYFVSLLNYIDIRVFGLYGAMSQSERTSTFESFVNCKTKGIMLATNVAARGLDIPSIDWIIQYDPPNDVKNYIHRVGRTNRGINEKNGKALLFLMKGNEEKYLDVLKKYNIEMKEYQYPKNNKIAKIQNQLEKITNSVYHLHVQSHQAYQSYIREYGLRNSRTFDVLQLNIINIAKQFGLTGPPKMTVQIKKKSKYKTVTMRLPTNQWANAEDKYDLDMEQYK